MKKFLLVMLVLAASSALLASNMGFKLTYALTKVGNAQMNWVSLPYYWGTGATASTVCTDIGANATQVSHWVKATETYEDWLCGSGTDFTIAPGEAIMVKVSTATNWVIVGSHNPSQTVNLQKLGNSQMNWVSVPYHTTRTNASGICTDVGVNATQVSHWVRATEQFEDWLCGSGTDFTITPGEGVMVKVSTATTWTPSHY